MIILIALLGVVYYAGEWQRRCAEGNQQRRERRARVWR